MLNMPHHRLGPITMAGAITMPKSWSLRRTIITTIVFLVGRREQELSRAGQIYEFTP
jgi:hypothetical protein